MALAIKYPGDAGATELMKMLVKERPTGFGKTSKIIYAIMRDEEGNLRIPVALCKQLWNLVLPDYLQLPRYKIDNKIEIGAEGRNDQIPIYQRLTESIVKDRYTFLSIYCGFGKSVIATKLACELGLITGFATDSTLIFPQWVNYLKKNTNAVVAAIDSPVEVLPPAHFYVFMITACGKMHPKILEPIKLLIVDEATYFMTPKRVPALMHFTPSYTLGLCAEVKRDDRMECFLPYFFGTTLIREISQKPFLVYRVDTPFKPTFQMMRYTGRPDWNLVLKSLADNEERNNIFIKLCLKLKTSKIIIGTKRKKQAQYIHDKLKEAGESVALLMENAKNFPPCRILIGIYGKMGKGVDPKNLCLAWEGDVFDVAIFGLDLVNPEQFVGRVFRHKNPIIYDFVDDLSTLRKHFESEAKEKPGRIVWYKSRNGTVIHTNTIEILKDEK
jgi:hypothetical protein